MRRDSAAKSSNNGKGKQADFGQAEIVDGTDLTNVTDPRTVSPFLSLKGLRSKDKAQREPGIYSTRKSPLPVDLEVRALEPIHQDEDQSVSSPSKAGPSRSAARGWGTLTKLRLRPRPTQTHTPPSDWDDEAVEEDGEDGGAEDNRADLYEDDIEASSMGSRTLWSEKVVGAVHESLEMYEAEDEEVSVDEDETVKDETMSAQSELTSDVEDEEDSDMGGEAGEESMEECEHGFLLC